MHYKTPQRHFYSLCGSLRVTAALCYQPTLSSLIPTAPPRGSAALSRPSHGALVMCSSGNPNPHYCAHYFMLHKGDLFPGIHPLTQIKCGSVCTDTHAPRLKCTSCLSRLSRSIPAGSLSLCSKASAIRCLRFFVCFFVLEYKGRVSLSIHRFSFIISPHSHCVLSLFHVIILILFFNCIASCYDPLLL